MNKLVTLWLLVTATVIHAQVAIQGLPNLLVPAADYGVLEHYLKFVAIAGCIRNEDQIINPIVKTEQFYDLNIDINVGNYTITNNTINSDFTNHTLQFQNPTYPFRNATTSLNNNTAVLKNNTSEPTEEEKAPVEQVPLPNTPKDPPKQPTTENNNQKLTSPDYILPKSKTPSCKKFCSDFPDMEFTEIWIDFSPVVGTLWGYVAVDHESERVVVVTRGFMQYEKYKQLDHRKQQLIIPEYDSKPVCNDAECLVDKVIYDAYSQVWAQVRQPLSDALKKYSRYSLYVAGHNTGGGIAQLMAITLKLLSFDPLLVTIGAPAIGTSAFAAWHDKLFNVGGPIVYPNRNEQGHWVPTKRNVIQITSLDHQYQSIEHFGSEKWPEIAYKFLSLHDFKHTGGRVGLKSDDLGWPAAYYLDNFFATMAAANVDLGPEEGLIPPIAIPNKKGIPEVKEDDDYRQKHFAMHKKRDGFNVEYAKAAYDPFKYKYSSVWYAIPMYCENNDLEEYSINHDYCVNHDCKSLLGPWNMIPSFNGFVMNNVQ